MSLYSYRKGPIKLNQIKKDKQTQEVESGKSLWTILYKAYYFIKEFLSRLRFSSLVVPTIFIISGLSILFTQLKPYAVHFVEAKLAKKYDQEIISLVPESYDNMRLEYISDPGNKYFSTFLGNLGQTDPISPNYSGKFYLTIEKAKIYDAPVTANIESSDPNIYSKALNYGLAHFKGTRIPCIDIEQKPYGNSFIYGHSAAGDYAEKHPWDITTAFTNLFKLNIGDEIKIKIEDKECSYTVTKIKEIDPEDSSVLNDKPNLTLTLMTCSPPGLDSKRLIIVANQN